MKKTAPHTAKDAYLTQLDTLRANIAKMREAYEAAVGDGTLSDRIDYAHVGNLEELNRQLTEAMRWLPRRVG